MELELSIKDLVSHYTKSTCLAVKTTGDGRCLFHSVSLCIFGNENYTHIIKIACVFVMLENETYFRQILSQQDNTLSFEKLIEDNANNDVRGTHFSIIALSLFLLKDQSLLIHLT